MNMRSAALAAISLSISLAACGGGGGGSSPIPSSGGGVTPKGHLRAAFARGTGTSSVGRSTKGLVGGLVPIADFVVPDANVGYVPQAVNAMDSVAYYDPAAPVPSPLPTGVTWTVSGAAGGTTSNAQVGQGFFGQPTSIGEVLLTSNGTTGAGTLTANASNGDSVALAFYTYAGNALDAESSYTPSNTGVPAANTQPCLTFPASGPPTPGTSGDLCLTINADKTTSLTAPGGLMILQKTIDQVTAADLATFNPAQTVLAGSIIAPPVVGETFTIVAKTSSGFVKFMPNVVNTTGDARVSAGQPIYAFGHYRVGTNAGWDI